MALTEFLSSIANAIRSKDGTTEPIIATDFPQRILNIPSGSGGLPNNIITGTFTIPQDTQENSSFNHGLAFKPDYVFVFPDNPNDAIPYSVMGGCSVGSTKLITSNTGKLTEKYNMFTLSIDEEKITFSSINTAYTMRSALVYRWYVWT